MQILLKNFELAIFFFVEIVLREDEVRIQRTAIIQYAVRRQSETYNGIQEIAAAD
jgi:hypothetical protein